MIVRALLCNILVLVFVFMLMFDYMPDFVRIVACSRLQTTANAAIGMCESIRTVTQGWIWVLTFSMLVREWRRCVNHKLKNKPIQ